jgi:hypothetical protein
MIKIIKIKVIDPHRIKFLINDHTEKEIDFSTYIGNDKLTGKLKDPDYFKQVKIYENGRGIYWPNGYDFCPDFLKHHTEDSKKNVA